VARDRKRVDLLLCPPRLAAAFVPLTMIEERFARAARSEVPRLAAPPGSSVSLRTPAAGVVERRDRLGGLIHEYGLAA
jgi:hypothetical protein